MIIVKDFDFEMEQVKTTPFFDLKLPVIINEGKENQRSEMKITDQGIPFETCIQKVVSRRLSLHNKVYNAVEFMEEYVTEVNKININLVSYISKIPKIDKKKVNVDVKEDSFYTEEDVLTEIEPLETE